ncbi:hypothetical protein BH11GEM2_BH11GEM2_26570 [soil metagenome]
MHIDRRSPRLLLLTLCAIAAAHCALPAPAFADQSPTASAEYASSSVDQAPTAEASHPGVEITAEQISAANGSPAPTAPAPSPVESAAGLAIDERDPRERVVDEWFAKHFHGLGAHLSEYLHGRLRMAVDDLKALLLALPLS